MWLVDKTIFSLVAKTLLWENYFDQEVIEICACG